MKTGNAILGDTSFIRAKNAAIIRMSFIIVVLIGVPVAGLLVFSDILVFLLSSLQTVIMMTMMSMRAIAPKHRTDTK